MTELTEKMMARAHEAWLDEAERWKVERVESAMSLNGGNATYLVEPVMSPLASMAEIEADRTAYHRFDGKEAKIQAWTFVRDKCLRAALTVALETTS